MTTRELPEAYASTLRTLLRYSIVMSFVALIIGIAFRESSKKLPFSEAPAGIHLESVIQLALVHGHVFTLGVLLPLALAGALLIARRTGGAEMGSRSLAWLTRGYLPFAAASLALFLYKGYHFLLLARAGERDLAIIDDALFGGSHVIRYAIYAVIHVGMSLSLGVFLVSLWRSLSRRHA